MIKLNSISNSKSAYTIKNFSSVNFNARPIDKNSKDEFVSTKKANINVAEEFGKLFTNPKALKLIEKEINFLQGCKQRTTLHETGHKTVTFHKGLRIFPNSYKGEINYNPKGDIYSFVIMDGNKELYNKIPCRKTVIYNKVQGLQIIHEKNNSNHSVAEAIFNLDGKIEEKKLNLDNKIITLRYNNGKISTKDITFLNPTSNTPIDHIRHRYNDPVVREIIDYETKYGVQKREAYDKDFNLIYKKLSGIKDGKAIINITKGIKNGRAYEIIETCNKDNRTYSIQRGDLEIRFKTKGNILCTDSEKIPVELYKNDVFRGIKKVNAKKIIIHLSL